MNVENCFSQHYLKLVLYVFPVNIVTIITRTQVRVEKKQVLNLPHKFKDLYPYYCKNYKNTTIYYIGIQVPKYFFKNHNLPKTFRKFPHFTGYHIS